MFLVWLALIGHEGFSRSGAARSSVGSLPGDVVRGLTATVVGLAGTPVVALALVVVVSVVVTQHYDVRRMAAPIGLAVTTVVLFATVALGREGLGPHGVASRYLYFTGAFLLPAIAVAATELIRRSQAGPAVGLVVMLVAVAHGTTTIVRRAGPAARYEQSLERVYLASADLGASGARLLSDKPTPGVAPDVTVRDLARMKRHHQLPSDRDVGAVDRLWAELRLQVSVTGRRAFPMAADEPGCRTFTGAGSSDHVVLSFRHPASVALTSDRGGTLALSLGSVSGAPAAGPRSEPLPRATVRFLNVTVAGNVMLDAPAGALEVCP